MGGIAIGGGWVSLALILSKDELVGNSSEIAPSNSKIQEFRSSSFVVISN